MNKPKRIKISKIENKMLAIGVKLSRIECLSHILYQCILEDCNLNPFDTEALADVLMEEICRTKKRFNKVQSILNI